MMEWIDVCGTDDLQPDSGVCALVNNQQVAIFFIVKESQVYALSNHDPFSKTNILSRGLIGDIGGQLVVASPMYKQHFNLITGACLEDDTVSIPVFPVRIDNARVLIGQEASS
ncbi:MAG: nitrite reductase small subunit NirD [Methylococcaceae bacterium]|jgi:nitrite reductase (NADH) small subunit